MKAWTKEGAEKIDITSPRGQATMARSVPVVVAEDQTEVLTSQRREQEILELLRSIDTNLKLLVDDLL